MNCTIPARTLSQSFRSSLRQSKLRQPTHPRSLSVQRRQYTFPRFHRHVKTPTLYFALSEPRQFHLSANRHVGLMPDTSDPQPKESEPHERITQPTEVSHEEYHRLADLYLEELLQKVEKMQEGAEGIDVEYSAGVMTIEVSGKGNYVLNKQPPNKQIWLSSPISGPKRYDWVVTGESMHQKQGSGSGDWVYLRDGSSLSSLLRKEIGIEIGAGEGEWQSEPNQTVTE